MELLERKQLIESIKDTLVLHDFDVVRLTDVVEGIDDFYWLLRNPITGDYRASCALKLIPLKEKISDEEYEYLEFMWKLNYEF